MPAAMTRRARLRGFWRRYDIAIAGSAVFAFILLVTVLADAVAPYDPMARNIKERFATPSAEYAFGTDQLGRDVLSRVMHGGRPILSASFAAVLAALAAGASLGVAGAYVGGWLDILLMRLMDVMLSFPSVLLAILIVATLGSGLLNVTVAIGFAMAPVFARLARSIVITLVLEEYVLAARSLGASDGHIIGRHIIPNMMPPIIVQASAMLAVAIGTASALNFIGLGVEPGTPDWGMMVAEGQRLLFDAPHVPLFPGVVITITVLSINYMGDGLRDHLDPKLAAPRFLTDRKMIAYLAKRLIWLPFVLWAVSSLTFFALRIVPGNPIQTVQNQVMDRSQLAQVEAVWGLNRPVGEQYLNFLSKLVRGDLGLAMSSGVPIRRMIFERMPPTIELAVTSLVISTVIGVLSGVASVTIRNRLVEYGVRTASILGLSLPIFWVGIMLIILFSVNLRWTPTNGRIGAGVDYETITNFMFYDLVATGNWEAFGSFLRHLILPGVTIGLTSAGFVARLTRSTMLEVMSSDYVRTARAKGLFEGSVIWQHAMRNAMLPIITLQGLQFGAILGGAVITERVFSYPGLGAWLLDGILERDYSVVQGGIIFVALAYVLMNMLVDVLYHIIDPRAAQPEPIGGAALPSWYARGRSHW